MTRHIISPVASPPSTISAGFTDDAFVRDAEAGIYVDPDRMHVLNHKGQYLSVRGPLNIARPVQGWPVIVQAGASEPGRKLAAATAEVVFGAASSLRAGKAFCTDLKGRMPALGRDPDSLKILPGAFMMVGDTVEEAQAKRANLDSLVHYERSIYSLIGLLGCDVSESDPDGPLPEIPPTYAGQMEEWLHDGGCDGFNIMFPYLPEGLNDFVSRVVSELQRRGHFRTEYDGATLRENLGLAQPENQFFPDASR